MPRPTVGALALAASLLLSVLAVPAPTHAEPVGHTSWTVRGQEGEPVSGGRQWRYTPSVAEFAVAGDASSVHLVVERKHRWDAHFAAPEGGLLAAGTTYTGATREPFENGSPSGTPGLLVTREGGGACSPVTGEFTVHEATFDETGQVTSFSVTFEQHCGTESDPALYGSIAWQAEGAQPVQPMVAISTGSRKYSHGRTAIVVAELTPGSPVRGLSIYARVRGQERQLIRSGTADDNGRLKARFPMTRRTTFTAEIDGEGRYDDLSDSTTVTVRADVEAFMWKPDRVVGRYAHYRVSRRAYIVGYVQPDHAGDCLFFKVQYHVDSRWRYRDETRCVRMNDERSASSAYLDGTRHLVGVPVRSRAVFRGDKDNTGASSPWQYFKFVRRAAARTTPPARTASSTPPTSPAEFQAPPSLR